MKNAFKFGWFAMLSAASYFDLFLYEPGPHTLVRMVLLCLWVYMAISAALKMLAGGKPDRKNNNWRGSMYLTQEQPIGGEGIRVGGVYRTREGKIVDITGKRSDPDYPFTGSVRGDQSLKGFASMGNYIGESHEHRLDLVSEMVTESSIVRQAADHNSPRLVPLSEEKRLQGGGLYVDGTSMRLIQIDGYNSEDEYPFKGQVILGEPYLGGARSSFTVTGIFKTGDSSGILNLTARWTGTLQEWAPGRRNASNAPPEMARMLQTIQFPRTPGISIDYSAGGVVTMEILRSGEHAFGRTSTAPEPAKTTAPAKVPVAWEDIVGQEEAKTLIREAVEAQAMDPEVYAHFSMPQSKGVLLYGPPGCGKTMLGKYAAGLLAKSHGKPYGDGFIYKNGAEILGPGWCDETDFFKKAFREAEEFYQRNRYPAVLFFDECDACLPPRERTSMFHRNAVNLFLTKMDGMEARTCFVMLATNHLEMLDEAAVRHGRVDKRIFVGYPTKDDVHQLLQTYLGKAVRPAGVELSDLVDAGHALMYHEKLTLEEEDWTAKLSGAQLAALAAEATRQAFRRAVAERKAGETDKARWGVTPADVEAGVRMLHEERKVALARKKADPYHPENLIRRADQHLDRLERLRRDDPPADDLDDLLGGKGSRP